MESRRHSYANNSMEKEALLQFRRNLSDVLKPEVSDAVLLKWLRVRNFNLRKCEQLYREHMWANQFYKLGPDYDVFRLPKVIEKFNFANPLGIAKDGTPMQYVAMGRGDLKGFLNSIDIMDIGKYCSDVIERDLNRCKEQSKKLGRDINEITYIVDMDQFSLRQVFFHGVVELGLDLFQMLQDHYPEIWSNILVVNVPVYFQTVFNIFKPIFRRTFLQKIFVASRDHTANLLLKYIDPEELPAFLGGKLVDSYGNSTCDEFMKFGGTIPQEYYLRNIRPPLLPTDPGVIDVCIPPKGHYNCPFVAREPDSLIRIEICSEGGSIASVILYREFGPDPERLDLPQSDEFIDENDVRSPWKKTSPFAHTPGHISPLNNFCHAVWPGIYVLRLDNSWNWLTSRRVMVRIKVLPPGTSPY